MDEGGSIQANVAALPATLDEIERLIAFARAAGTPLDPWIMELADALRDAAVETPRAADLARMMCVDPAASLGAQGPAAPAAAQLLNDCAQSSEMRGCKSTFS